MIHTLIFEWIRLHEKTKMKMAGWIKVRGYFYRLWRLEEWDVIVGGKRTKVYIYGARFRVGHGGLKIRHVAKNYINNNSTSYQTCYISINSKYGLIIRK